MMNFGLILISLLNVVVIALVVRASHFRGGSMSFEPFNETDTEVYGYLETRVAWRRDRQNCFCDATTISKQVLFGEPGDIYCAENCDPVYTKPYTVIGDVQIYCTSFSVSDNWAYGSRKTLVRLPKKDNVQIVFNGSAWIALNQFGVGSDNDVQDIDWEMRLNLNLSTRSDTGTINYSPITLVPPVIKVRLGAVFKIIVPTYDRNGDDVRCRWSDLSRNECGDVCFAIPGSTMNEATCEIVFDSNKAAVGWYAVALQLDDFASKTSNKMLSTVPVQFLVNVVKSTSTCNIPPTIIGDIAAQSCLTWPVNTLFDRRIVALENCTTEKIDEIQVMGPFGLSASQAAQISGTRQWYSTLNWRPTASQIGANLICATAKSSSVLTSTLNCFTLLVGIQNPKPANVTPSGLLDSELVYKDGNLNFSVDFLKSIIKPDKSAFIRIYDSSLNKEVLKIDTSKLDAVANFDKSMMHFSLPLENINTPGTTYYGTFDDGAALSAEYCNPASLAETRKTFWTFTIPALTTTTNTSISTTTSTTEIITEELTTEIIESSSSTDILSSETPTTMTTTMNLSLRNCSIQQQQQNSIQIKRCNLNSFVLLACLEWVIFLLANFSIMIGLFWALSQRMSRMIRRKFIKRQRQL